MLSFIFAPVLLVFDNPFLGIEELEHLGIVITFYFFTLSFWPVFFMTKFSPLSNLYICLLLVLKWKTKVVFADCKWNYLMNFKGLYNSHDHSSVMEKAKAISCIENSLYIDWFFYLNCIYVCAFFCILRFLIQKNNFYKRTHGKYSYLLLHYVKTKYCLLILLILINFLYLCWSIFAGVNIWFI